MKTKITLLLALVLSSLFISAQTVMNIHQSNGSVLQLPLNTIDSITYTISSSGIQYGNGVTDIDGNSYQTVIIGNQEWMAENLRTTKYADGTAIPNVNDGNQWGNLDTGAWCNYENSSLNGATYGKLYNWYAVDDSRNVCPTGWHVPTDAEWTVLTDYLAANGHFLMEGRALKATSGWNGLGGNGTDDYGWLGLPGGNRSIDGRFYRIGHFGYWWSSLEYSTHNGSYVLCRYLSWGDRGVDSSSPNKESGLSVRCLRD